MEMPNHMSFVFVYLLLIHLVNTDLLSRPNRLHNKQSKTALRNYRFEFLNEVRQEHWDGTVHKLAKKAATCDSKEIDSIKANAACKLRREVIVLSEPYGFHSLDPSHVEVMRCSGKCKKDCLPSKNVIKVSVMAKPYNEKDFTCLDTEIEVEEHTACKCGCKIKWKDCIKPQIYNPALCRCECQNQGQAHPCQQTKGKEWNSTSCGCIDKQ